MKKQMKVLVVDDTEPNLLLISKFISKLGHQAVLARNGLEAVRQFQSESPDLILMDVMMPEMDGFEATARIRVLAPNKWVPIIFLTAKAQDADHVRGIQAGGDDFISKPINLVILEARIKAILRIAEMQRQIAENTEQLERYRDENESELQLARHLIKKITHYDHYDHQLIQLFNQPAQHFSGDIFISALTPSDDINLLLADGTGHGLSAALNVIPVVEVFYSMTSKGFAISAIAHELNRKIKQLMPTERFVAASLVSINFNDRILHIWNGGNPPAYFVNENGQILRSWRSSHPALGIFDESDFDATTEAFHWNEPGSMYMCSDGLIEARNPLGEEFGQTRLEKILSNVKPEHGSADLIQTLRRHMDDVPAHDDITLAAIRCPVSTPVDTQGRESATGQATKAPAVCPCRWKVGVRLTAFELKEIDVVPMLLAWMDQLHLNPNHRGQVFLIFTELFNNALDHGLLCLDSALKYQPDGFDQYFEQRRQRLANLQQGVLEIEVERLRQQGQELLRIHMKDTGHGFDYKLFLSRTTAESTRPFGRGLALIKSLCSRLDYAHNGSEVTVDYALT